MHCQLRGILINHGVCRCSQTLGNRGPNEQLKVLTASLKDAKKLYRGATAAVRLEAGDRAEEEAGEVAEEEAGEVAEEEAGEGAQS